MPLLRYRRRRLPIRARRVLRRRPRVYRAARSAAVIPRPIRSKAIVYPFHRTIRFDATNAANANPWFVTGTSVHQMQLNSLPGYTDFTNMFNYYKITMVKYQFRVTYAPEAQTAANSLYPQVYLANYFNDQINWSTLAQADETQKKRVVTLKPGRYVKHTIRPCTANMSTQYPIDASNPTGVANYSTPQWNRWIPTTQPGVDFYGVRNLIKDMPTTQNLETLVTVYLQCKDPK